MTAMIGLSKLSRIALAAAAAALLHASPLAAQQAQGQGQEAQPGGQERYNSCMRLTQSDPGQALAEADAWRAQGGGFPAEHCGGVALLSLGRFEEGAKRLTAMADAMDSARPGLRVGAYGQAGQAWTMAGNNEAALAAQNKGLKIDPDNVELLIDRSFSHALAKDFWAALDDLNRAHDLAPKRPDILVFRASTYRFLETPELALDDVNQALSMQPNLPEGLLERGILYHQAGKNAEAKADWEKLVKTAPDSPAAKAAGQYMDRLN
jgi:tetratricopeptide (TPR) repeat protein